MEVRKVMSKQYDQQTAARLMANIHRKKRPDNLVKIAGYIRRLESDVGSLEAVSEIPEDAVLRATLTSRECRQSLAIRSIEDDKSGYRLKCICPGK